MCGSECSEKCGGTCETVCTNNCFATCQTTCIDDCTSTCETRASEKNSIHLSDTTFYEKASARKVFKFIDEELDMGFYIYPVLNGYLKIYKIYGANETKLVDGEVVRSHIYKIDHKVKEIEYDIKKKAPIGTYTKETRTFPKQRYEYTNTFMHELQYRAARMQYHEFEDPDASTWNQAFLAPLNPSTFQALVKNPEGFDDKLYCDSEFLERTVDAIAKRYIYLIYNVNNTYKAPGSVTQMETLKQFLNVINTGVNSIVTTEYWDEMDNPEMSELDENRSDVIIHFREAMKLGHIVSGVESSGIDVSRFVDSAKTIDDKMNNDIFTDLVVYAMQGFVTDFNLNPNSTVIPGYKGADLNAIKNAEGYEYADLKAYFLRPELYWLRSEITKVMREIHLRKLKELNTSNTLPASGTCEFSELDYLIRRKVSQEITEIHNQVSRQSVTTLITDIVNTLIEMANKDTNLYIIESDNPGSIETKLNASIQLRMFVRDIIDWTWNNINY